MAKSGDNFYTLNKVRELGFEPMVFRYFILTAHYRSELEFSIESLKAAQGTLEGIYRILYDHPEAKPLADKTSEWYMRFIEAIRVDLDSPKALSVMHEMLASSLTDNEKRAHLLAFDEILGLGFAETASRSLYLTEQELQSLQIDGKSVAEILTERDTARKARDWSLSDMIRQTAQASGYLIEDTPHGQKVKKSR